MHNFSFVITNISRSSNKVGDALSRRSLIIQEFQVKTLGFEHLKEMYQEDPYFKEDYEACENPFWGDIIPCIEYLIQDGLLFKGSQLYIPRCSMRDNLLKEKHSGGLVEHIGHDKTYEKLSYSYYWPGMRSQGVCEQMKNCPVCKRETTKQWLVSTIAYSKNSLG
jgi:hypothetical protein